MARAILLTRADLALAAGAASGVPAVATGLRRERTRLKAGVGSTKRPCGARSFIWEYPD